MAGTLLASLLSVKHRPFLGDVLSCVILILGRTESCHEATAHRTPSHGPANERTRMGMRMRRDGDEDDDDGGDT